MATGFEKEQLREFVRRYWVVWVSVFLIVVVVGFALLRSVRDSHADARAQFEQDSSIVEEEANAQGNGKGSGSSSGSKSDEDSESVDDSSQGLVLGVGDLASYTRDADRRDVLIGVTEEIVSLVMNWDSGDSYMANREKLAGLVPGDSQVLTVMMPEVKDKIHDGVRYNYIDQAGVNSYSSVPSSYLGRWHVWSEGDVSVVSTVMEARSHGSSDVSNVLVRVSFDKDNKVKAAYMGDVTGFAPLCGPSACTPEGSGPLARDELNGGPVDE